MEGHVATARDVHARTRATAWTLGVLPLLLIAVALVAFIALGSPGLGQRTGPPSDSNSLPAFEAALAASPDARLRRLGLAAAVAQATQPAGWTAALRARLDQYRADPTPLVAAAAQFTFPPQVSEEEIAP